MKEILVVGLAAIDVLFELSEMPQSPEKHIATNASVVGGGGAANAAVAIARLNAKPRLAARVGDDVFGDLIVSQLTGDFVDCSLVQRTKSAQSSYSSVLIDRHGERQIVNFRGSDLSDDASVFSDIKVDGVLADTRWKAGTLEAMRLARRLNVPGVIDAEAPVIPEALELASHVAFSRQGLTQFTGETDLQSALIKASDATQAWVCVTDGEHGVYYPDSGRVRNVPARATEVVDTLGAGDVWHGAFVVALTQHRTEIEAIEFANVSASLKCARHGGGRRSPTLDEVMQCLCK